MRFGQITRGFTEGFRNWDVRSKSAFIMALVLLILVLMIGGRLPETQRTLVIIGIVGLLVAMQAIFLYANRGMVTSVTQAQRLILAARYDEARVVLEKALSEKEDAAAQTLLGNTYRMLGRVDESAQTLTKALQTLPNGHFPLYSLGRTLMASGAYADAAATFRLAMDAGAPVFAQVDLAEACFRAKLPVEPMDSVFDEPHIALMAAYVLWQSGLGEPPEAELVEAGGSYWQKTASRFAHTPYGPAIESDLALLRGLSRHT